MAKKYFTDESLSALVDEIKAGDAESLSSAKSYTDTEVAKITNGTTVVPEAEHATSADTASAVAWANVTGKPSTYTPSSHSHTISDVTDLQSTIDTINAEIDGSISGLSISGKIITYTKNDGTTGTITTQDTNTDTKVTQTVRTTNGSFPVLLRGTSAGTTTTTTTTSFGTGITANPSTSTLTATTFVGALSGNATSATSATKATQDANGNVITSTYETKTDASAKLTEAKTYSDTNLSTAKSYTDTAISNLINSAPSTLDTLGEIATAMEENADVVEALETAIGTKANASHTHAIADVTNLQSSLDAKQGTITGAATTITGTNLTANRALISNNSGKVAVSAVTSTELGYLDGVTSAIQTQLDGKALSSHTHTASLATDTGTSAITLAHGSKYKLTAGGSSVIFTMPTDKNTTYSAGTGISLSGTTFSNSGVRSISAGSTNGTISVNTGGTSAEVAVKGLGAAAYTSIDTALSTSSTNAVRNSVVTTAINSATSAISANTDSISAHTTAITNLQTTVNEFEEITSDEIQSLFNS